MTDRTMDIEQAMAEIEDLRARLEEAEEGIMAIQSGQVDAVVVTGPEGEQIYTLSGAERTYRILVEAMNEGALVLSPEGAIVYSNHTFAAMLGASVYEILGHSIYEFVADADAESLRRMLQQAPLRTGRREISLKHGDQDSVPAFVSVGSLETEEGASVSAVITDLTEHKRTEAELGKYREHLEDLVMERTKELARSRADAERSAAELNAFVSSMADGVVLFNAEPRVVMVNEAARKLVGAPPDLPIEEWAPLHELYTLDGKLVAREEFPSMRALSGQETKGARFRMVTPWTESLVSISGSPVRDAKGRVIGGTLSFRDVADQVELESQRQELYEREHHISEMLQEALIPSQTPYAMQRLSIAARYKPALKEAQVGGDFYDIFELGNNKIGVLIGDVAGKGLQAAIRVAAARHSVRSYAYLDTSPGRVMTLANDALCRDGHDVDSILTAFFAVVDTSDCTMTYASAGHEPPVICNAHEGVEELAVTGAMLGIIPGALYSERTVNLREGDSVVMFTDGITEARRNGSILFGKPGVIAHLTKACDAPPDQIAEALLEAATLHAEGDLQDDVAIVVLGVEKGT